MILILSYALLFISLSVYSQENKLPVNIQSPDAGGLGKFGDVPVSHFTGTPNISVPIHSLSVNGIDLNISINYDASGVPINQHQGWVGQNWTLSLNRYESEIKSHLRGLVT